MDKIIMQQNRIKSLHHNINLLEQRRRCSNVPGRLHQSPAVQLAQELKNIPINWTVGLHRDGAGHYNFMLMSSEVKIREIKTQKSSKLQAEKLK